MIDIVSILTISKHIYFSMWGLAHFKIFHHLVVKKYRFLWNFDANFWGFHLIKLKKTVNIFGKCIFAAVLMISKLNLSINIAEISSLGFVCSNLLDFLHFFLIWSKIWSEEKWLNFRKTFVENHLFPLNLKLRQIFNWCAMKLIFFLFFQKF